MTGATQPLGAPIWLELLTSDLKKSEEFYAGLFGWTFTTQYSETASYLVAELDGELVGAIKLDDGVSGPVDFWTTFLHTADVKATEHAVLAAGGEVLIPAGQLNEYGSFMTLLDSVGSRLGAYQPATFPGIQVRGEPGTLGWNELTSSEYAAVAGFYRDVFDVDVEPVSDNSAVNYALVAVDEEYWAGVVTASGEEPAVQQLLAWQVYFQVADLDAALKKTRMLGGSVAGSPVRTARGRVARVIDSTGSSFKLLERNSEPR